MTSARMAACAALVGALLGCESTPVVPGDAGNEPDAGPVVDCSGRPAEAPAARGELAGAYDEARGRIVMYGGNTAAPVMCMPAYEHTEEVWAFHVDCGNWERITPSGTGPGARARVASTIDTMRDRILFFGGRDRAASGDYVNYGDVWAYDLATDAWSEITTSGTGPAVRSGAVIAYDEARDRMLMFGGNTSTSGLALTGVGDLWELDLASGAWREIMSSGETPSPRLYHSGVVLGSELIVVGGTPDFDGPFLNDAWALDLTNDTWRLINDGFDLSTPEPRFGHELVADAARGRVVMIAGHDRTDLGNTNDAWALDVASGTWTVLRPGDELNGMAAGRCDFPADFTIPEENSPERRYAFGRGWDAERAFVFGGKTDCGNVNDVWALELETGAWERLRAPTGGEACNRSGRVGCTSLCF
ncbi:MAG: hypothetical protein M3Y87_13280 [Myxococcota bacterium]|nr:hypothetical protein [Myxococcota bacterium]